MLEKDKADITIWSLLASFINHGKALLKALTGIEVPVQTTLEELVSFFIIERSPSSITFDNISLPSEGMEHNKALYLSTTCKNKSIPMTL